MTAINQLMHEIETLPAEYIPQVIDFIGYLKAKKNGKISETMLMCESALSDWNTPEEDEVWAYL